MIHLLTTIEPCLLLTMVAVTPSTTEAISFKGSTAAQGVNLNAIRPHPSPSASPRWQEAEPFTGDLGLYADRTLAYPLAIGFAPRVNDLNIYSVNSDDVQNYGLTTVAIISAGFHTWNPATAAPEPLSLSLFSTAFLLAVVRRRKRLPSERKLNQHIRRGL
jgi:hypothetical protein